MWKVEFFARRAGWWITDDRIFPNLTDAHEHGFQMLTQRWATAFRVVPTAEGQLN
jgi:hypothetical protein